ncbi:MAG: SpoIIE family protein phosphatase, partial [Actinomycetota bacterium]|nr:SpoIIE family protein phosphatase [Actinomycetota bacterium]
LGAVSAFERSRLAGRSAEADRSARRSVTVGIVALVALLLLLGLLVYFVDRLVVRPVRRFGVAVEHLREGDLGVRVHQAGPAEIADLGGAIDELAASLDESRRQVEASSAELRRLSERNLMMLDSVFSQTPVGLAFLDAELRYVRVNAALAAMSGKPVDAHIGRPADEVVPDLSEQIGPAMERVLATGRPVSELEVTGTTAADPGMVRSWAVTLYPVREQGEVAGVGLVVIDITERRRYEAERDRLLQAERDARQGAEAARGRAAFLVDAGGLLDASLELEDTVQSLARLCVPRIADWCSISLVESGELSNAAVAHADPERMELARRLQQRYPPERDAAFGAAAVVRTGRAEHYAEISDELLESAARDPEHRDLMRGLGMRSAIVVPLTARGQVLGAITLVSAESGRRYDLDDFALVQDLGVRAGLALDNARLYRERSDVARTLQASLLPERLPQIPGMQIAARYEPLGASTDVGGDFYDVFQITQDRWAVVIGDVCGKGAEAAALTALARYTLRAVAPSGPVDALRQLNTAILRQRDDLRFITVVYAEIDLAANQPHVRLASGGHPPPLLVHPIGPGQVIECKGTLIGITPDPALSECSLEMASGDTLALYTDGVTESSHAEPLEPGALLETIAGHRSADAVADHLQRLARTRERLARDDVAILALQAD